MRQTHLLSFVLLASVIASCGDGVAPVTTTPVIAVDPPAEAAEVRRCFLSVTTSGDGTIVDSMSLQLTIKGDHVTGRMDWLPGAKDKMRGTLEGTVKYDTITARYSYTAEGVNNVEERMLHLSTGYVAVLTGDMIERDGAWVLKDPSKAVEGLKVPEVPCR